MAKAMLAWRPPKDWVRITTIDARTGGESFRVITGGLPELPGDTILERRRHMHGHLDHLGTALMSMGQWGQVHSRPFSKVMISGPKAVVDLAHWRMDNTASRDTINRLTGYLKSLGPKAPKSAVSDYLAWFEDAYLLFTVRIFDASLARANINSKKI